MLPAGLIAAMEITNELSLQDWTGTQLLSIVKNIINQGTGQKPGLNLPQAKNINTSPK